jgi:hypothetical protein
VSHWAVLALVFCVFFVSPVYADESDAWSGIRASLLGSVSGIAHDDLKLLPKVDVGIVTASGACRTVALGPTELLDIYKMVTLAANGDYAGARDQLIETSAGYVMPMLGSALAIQGAASTAIDAAIENWSEDLYDTEAYRLVLHEVNRLVNAPFHSDAKPYLPSLMMTDAALKQDMEAVETRYYENIWQHSHAVVIDLAGGGNPARIRRLIGSDPKTPRPVFHLFLKDVVRTQGRDLKFRFEKALSAHAASVKKQLEKETQKAVKKAMTALEPPRDLHAEAGPVSGKLKVDYSFKGSPVTTYRANISLERHDVFISEAVYKDLKTKSGVVHGIGELPLPEDGRYDLILIAESGYGNRESLRVPLTIETVRKPLGITGRMGTYDGPALSPGAAVQNGQILAFEAEFRRPVMPSGVMSHVSWQVETMNGEILPGIEKNEKIYEKGGTTTSRFRFVMDNVKDGDYRVVFTCEAPSRPGSKETAFFPVSVRKAVAVTRVLATPDKESQSHHRNVFVDDPLFLYAHYTLVQGIDTVTVTLTARDEKTGGILDQVTIDRPRKPGDVQRVGIAADTARFKAGQRIVFTAKIQTPDGRFAEESASFRINGYDMSIDAPHSMTSGQSANTSIYPPMGFEPVAIRCRSSAGFLTIRHQGLSRHPVLTAGKVKGRKKAVVTIQVVDAKGRTAQARKVIVVTGAGQ